MGGCGSATWNAEEFQHGTPIVDLPVESQPGYDERYLTSIVGCDHSPGCGNTWKLLAPSLWVTVLGTSR